MHDLLVKNGLVWVDHKWQNVNVAVLGEKISYVGTEEVEAKEVLDASVHVIINKRLLREFKTFIERLL